jgi:hypothetical protein
MRAEEGIVDSKNGERHFKKSHSILCKGKGVKYLFMKEQRKQYMSLFAVTIDP